jgi:hypothetical protein
MGVGVRRFHLKNLAPDRLGAGAKNVVRPRLFPACGGEGGIFSLRRRPG